MCDKDDEVIDKKSGLMMCVIKMMRLLKHTSFVFHDFQQCDMHIVLDCRCLEHQIWYHCCSNPQVASRAILFHDRTLEYRQCFEDANETVARPTFKVGVICLKRKS